MKKNNPLFDNNFLNQLYSKNEREVYAKITLLSFDEKPIECLEGKITDGSINIDNASAVRRTCSLSMVAEDVNINEFYWGLKSKFKLEVGLKNTINTLYPEIIWFKQGIFVLTQFNTTQSTNKWNIKLQGKDKMCLLNGDIAGNLYADVDFGMEEYHDLSTDTVTYKKIPIKTIIKKALQEFGKELAHNIIINDIDEAGQELLEYRGTEPLYLFKDIETQEFKQMTVNENFTCYYRLKNELNINEYNNIPKKYNFFIRDNIYTFNPETATYVFNQENANNSADFQLLNNEDNWFKGAISDSFNIIYDDLLDDVDFEGNISPTIVRFNLNGSYKHKRYQVAKFTAGDIPGYRMTDLVFAEELIGKTGESLTSVLDKIKNKFTNFEYYYDIDGKFVFQKKKEYITTPWNSVESDKNQIHMNSTINNTSLMFNLMDNKLITSFGNTPKYTNLKNDYTVWGARDKTTLHMRYAIDVKPTTYLPIRPLKERIHTIVRDSQNKIIEINNEYKYYDAPEEKPYNNDTLIQTDCTCDIIDLIEYAYDNNIQITKDQFIVLQEKLNNTNLEPDIYSNWLDLFETDTSGVVHYSGNKEDILNIIKLINNNLEIYGNKIISTEIQDDDNNTTIITIFPFFAKYPYTTESYIYYRDEETEEEKIRYKVDWRELIYQMALDYQKLNYTDDYLYYLAQANPFVTNYKTGYEQYYVDLLGFWRDLYNPNSSISFENIEIEELQKYRLSTQEDELTNLIYIESPYVQIEEENLNNLTYNTLYKYSKALNNTQYFIQDYLTSDDCYLDFNVNYYTENTSGEYAGQMNKYSASNQEDDNYNILNAIEKSKIYIKNYQNFEVQNYKFYRVFETYEFKVGNIDWHNKDNVFYKPLGNDEYQQCEVDEILDQNKEYYIRENEKMIRVYPTIPNCVYKKNFYYIYKNNKYLIMTGDFNPDYDYYYISYLNKSTEFQDKVPLPFEVLVYPRASALNTFSSDYISLLSTSFDKTKENILKDNTYYFIKDTSNKKLGDFKNNEILWKLYYNNQIYSICNKTKSIVATLETHENNKDNYINYLNKIQETIQSYCIYLINNNIEYNEENINNNIHTLLYDIIQQYYNTIINITKWGLNSRYNSSSSCLSYLLPDFLTRMEKIKINNDLNNFNNVTSLLKDFYNININLQYLNENINKNYSQVKFLIENQNVILEATTMANLITEMMSFRDSLSTSKEIYTNGQLEKTKIVVNDFLALYMSATDDSLLTEAKNYFKNIILEPINQLTEILNIYKNILIEDYPHKEIQDKILNYNISLFNYNNKESYYNKLLNLIRHISTLDQVFNEKIYNAVAWKSNLDSLLNYQNYLFFIPLQDITKGTQQNAIEKILQYNADCSVFQKYIFSQDIDNFNYTKSTTLIETPIRYKIGTYIYNTDKIQGNFWNKSVYDSPQTLTFWIDFLEPTTADIAKYAVPIIGDRIKAVNDKAVKAVHYKEIPSIIFKNPNQEKYDTLSGYTYINITDAFMNLFAISSKGKTAKERIDELLYNHSYCNENINISLVPIYTLEPNHKIYIKDEKSHVDGEYLVNKITLPLGYKKMMQITGIKSVTSIQ